MDAEKNFLHLARLALDGRADDVQLLVKRAIGPLMKARPDLEPAARDVLQQLTQQPTRQLPTPIPVDNDSRLELLRRELPDRSLQEPTWALEVGNELNSIVQERLREQEMIRAGLAPTRSVLFVGPPGVGKTLAARWLSQQLSRPLLILDLAAVMSSFLGRTGSNLRVVLDYARKESAVLLLDEFDAIAKRRDDAGDIGELKRLVTVLLQAIDDWPSSGLLLAATNHPELLDPAAWRRFERVVHFPAPSRAQNEDALRKMSIEASEASAVIACLLEGKSFSELSRIVVAAKRDSFLRSIPFEDAMRSQVELLISTATTQQKLVVADELAQRGKSQREISAVTGLSRDTIRKHEK